MSEEKPEPTIQFTKSELFAEARNIVFENCQPHELNARYEKLGVLVWFISKLFNRPERQTCKPNEFTQENLNYKE